MKRVNNVFSIPRSTVVLLLLTLGAITSLTAYLGTTGCSRILSIFPSTFFLAFVGHQAVMGTGCCAIRASPAEALSPSPKQQMIPPKEDPRLKGIERFREEMRRHSRNGQLSLIRGGGA